MEEQKEKISFEKEVAMYLTDIKGYDKAYIRPKDYNNVDILAKMGNKASGGKTAASLFCYIVGALLFAASFAMNIWVLLPLSVIILVAAHMLNTKKHKLETKYAWVQCSGSNDKVKRGAISDVLDNHAEYSKNWKRQHDIDYIIYFAEGGFEHDAIAKARKNGVVLYERYVNGGFVKTKVDS